MPRKIRTLLAMAPTEMCSCGLCSPSQSGQHREVEPAEGGEREDLEDRVERDQDGGGLRVAAGQVVPDQHHRDAPGQPDDDQPGAVGRQVRQHQPGEGEHQRRADHPVEHQAGDQQPAVGGDPVELGVADLGQHRVHHQQQPERDRQRRLPDLDRVQGVVQAGEQPAEQRGRATIAATDPDRQEPVQGGQPRCDVGRVGCGDGGLLRRGAHARTFVCMAPASSTRRQVLTGQQQALTEAPESVVTLVGAQQPPPVPTSSMAMLLACGESARTV